ncbi:MAG: hypothetical protein A2Z12_06670 [Actinobacteria bacterium RBG_16_68_21]|nr:MAG: hypothetical protein A2Z12_06670 [Actinobacteria bacterium RBG_16_68_21]
MTITTLRRPDTAVIVEADRLVIDHLVVADREVLALVGTVPEDERGAVIERALSVGARGLLTMGLGIDVAAVDTRVRQTLVSVADEAERRIGALLATAHDALASQFDPEQRSSLLGRALADFATWREDLLGRLDPAVEGSATTTFLARLAELVGRDGDLERRLAEALDPEADGSALHRIATTIDSRFSDLRDLIVHQHGVAEGRATEAERGTAQGIDFEDLVEGWTRAWAARIGGCIVERTGRTPGRLGPGATVGDLVVTLPDGHRIVVEAKFQATIGLGGKDGILKELERARDNREADAAVCISGRDAFPGEVGPFGVYGTSILAVDDDGTMTAVALRWAQAAVIAATSPGAVSIDVGAVADGVVSIRKLAEQLRSARATLTNVRKSVDGLSDTLGDLRNDLLDRAAVIERATGIVNAGA